MKKHTTYLLFFICNALSIFNSCYAQNRPNVLLIISDDQGIGDFAFMGNTTVQTPTLDGLAKESAVFENFVVAAACSPTRSSLMTGRNHLLAGVWGVGARNNLLRDETLLPQYFKANGYNTGYFGKRDGVYNLEKQAWNWGCDEVSHVTGYKHKDATSITHKGNIKREGWTCDIDVSNSLDFIKRQADKPWFCTTAFILPHLPWTPDDRFAKPYRDAGHSDVLADFYGCVTQMDSAMGNLLKGLADLGQLENTIILFLSDNGPSYKGMTEKDIQSRNPLALKGTKSMVWENGIIVPFLARWPQKIKPGIRKQYATVEDIVPTLIDLTGMQNKLPDHLPFDGVSLAPALLDAKTKSIDRQVLRVAISFEGAAGGTNNGIRGIVNDAKKVTIEEQHLILRGERFKYHDFADGTTALYDLHKDPSENKNVSEAYPKVSEHYKKELEKQYANMLSSNRLFRMPTVKIGATKKGGYNNIAGAMAKKASGIHEILRFHYLKGFAEKEDSAVYQIDVEKAGMYSLRILGENFSKTSQWELKQHAKVYTPKTIESKEMKFDKIEFKKSGRQLFTIKVNKNSAYAKKSIVKHLKFTFLK